MIATSTCFWFTRGAGCVDEDGEVFEVCFSGRGDCQGFWEAVDIDDCYSRTWWSDVGKRGQRHGDMFQGFDYKFREICGGNYGFGGGHSQTVLQGVVSTTC